MKCTISLLNFNSKGDISSTYSFLLEIDVINDFDLVFGQHLWSETSLEDELDGFEYVKESTTPRMHMYLIMIKSKTKSFCIVFECV